MDTDTLQSLEDNIRTAIASAESLEELDAVRIYALGKKSRISLMMRSVGKLEPAERKSTGQKLNALRNALTDAVETRKTQLHRSQQQKNLEREKSDLSLPPRPENTGRLHPTIHAQQELLDIFAALGFQTIRGPDIEDDFHNFGALNFSPNHPAREPSDTFFLQPDNNRLLRTHTSPVQIRSMMTRTPPIRVVVPGRVYRRDWDATHTPMFHQIEGLVIDQHSHMGHLKSCLDTALACFFARDVQSRFRPHFFPFTEPSAEMDLRCAHNGNSVRVGTGDQWMEILGCGMVHPNVLNTCSLDPEHYQGYAFGLGVDRLAMLKYGMADLRTFFKGDLAWLRAYGFGAFAN